MMAALHPSRNDAAGPNMHAAVYPGRALVAELDLQENRYPNLPSKNTHHASTLVFGSAERSLWENSSNGNEGFLRRSYQHNGPQRDAGSSSGWAPEQRENQEMLHPQQQPSRLSANSADIQSLRSQSQSQSQSQSLGPQRGALSYALPPGANRRVVERYSLDDNTTVSRVPSRGSANGIPIRASQDIKNAPSPVPGDSTSVLPLGVQRSTSPIAGIGAGGGKINGDYPIMPLSASPSYNPPVAPKHRAYALQPTYITPPTTLTPIKPSYSPRPPPQEEVCVECAMRDEDMADVDVTSPGVWERESDAEFEELKRREEEDDAKGLVTIDDPKRPRVKGGRLTEPNVKLWLSINPREPTSRQQTLRNYIKSQKALLEAEALAHARAMQEAKQLDSKMRDTYSQLRRSAYDIGNATSPADEIGGLRIKPPISPTTPQHNTHARSQSREITLLENGMIVEHVDVRKEEREARERKRREERRARKLSRGSTMDMTSIISSNSIGVPQTDGGYGLRPHSPYSPNSARPTSVLTAPIDRPELPRAYSQASFSEIHSMGSASPRRAKFFGFKNLSAGWRSQDSLAPSAIQSGSMIDMHLGLQRETQRIGTSPRELSTSRRSQLWLSDQPEASETQVRDDQADDSNPKKKKKGLAKIWGIVTGSNKQANATRRDPSQSLDRTEDDLPLAPPPPLSYLVNRGPSDLRAASGRHGSNPSLPSLASPKPAGSASPGMSPSTGSSSAIPSPASSRTSGPDVEIVEADHDDKENHFQNDTISKPPAQRNVHPMVSEPNMRQRRSRNISPPPPIPSFARPSRPPSMMSREKSLPPLPAEAVTRMPNGEPRPQTVYTYDPRQLPPGSNPAHDFLPPSAPFRTPDVRRQSFGGLSSRPNLAVQTMPLNGRQQTTNFGPRYDEFGASRRSLGPLDQFRDIIPAQTPPTKRKSRFGFASLLGKKSTPRESENVDQNVTQAQHQFPPMRRSGSGGLDDVGVNGYATSTSRHSALSTGVPQPRLSVTSRKVLEERVAQDPDFVAYRYPSNDQRLDLLR